MVVGPPHSPPPPLVSLWPPPSTPFPLMLSAEARRAARCGDALAVSEAQHRYVGRHSLRWAREVVSPCPRNLVVLEERAHDLRARLELALSTTGLAPEDVAEAEAEARRRRQRRRRGAGAPTPSSSSSSSSSAPRQPSLGLLRGGPFHGVWSTDAATLLEGSTPEHDNDDGASALVAAVPAASRGHDFPPPPPPPPPLLRVALDKKPQTRVVVVRETVFVQAPAPPPPPAAPPPKLAAPVLRPRTLQPLFLGELPSRVVLPQPGAVTTEGAALVAFSTAAGGLEALLRWLHTSRGVSSSTTLHPLVGVGPGEGGRWGRGVWTGLGREGYVRAEDDEDQEEDEEEAGENAAEAVESPPADRPSPSPADMEWDGRSTPGAPAWADDGAPDATTTVRDDGGGCHYPVDVRGEHEPTARELFAGPGWLAAAAAAAAPPDPFPLGPFGPASVDPRAFFAAQEWWRFAAAAAAAAVDPRAGWRW